MRVEERFEVACAIEDMYRQMNDVGEIGYCVAGVEDVTVHSADESTWRVAFRAGVMQRTVSLNARVVERQAPSRIVFAAGGQDVEITGHVELAPLAPDLTGCAVLIEASISGPLGPLIDLMAKGPQQQLIRETVSNLRTRLESAQSMPAPVSVAARRPTRITVWAVIRPTWELLLRAWRRLRRAAKPGRSA